MEKSQKFHTKFRVYFPKSISQDYVLLWLHWQNAIAELRNADQNYVLFENYVHLEDKEKYFAINSQTTEKKLFNNIFDISMDVEKLIERIQKYIGVETNEKLGWRAILFNWLITHYPFRNLAK